MTHLDGVATLPNYLHKKKQCTSSSGNEFRNELLLLGGYDSENVSSA